MKCCNIPAPILPTAYTEELSYGEALGKVITKVNECVDEVNNNDKKVDDLTNLVGTFDSRITTNTEDIASIKEDIILTNGRINDLTQETANSLSSLSTQIVDTNKKVDTNTTNITDLTSSLNTTNTKVNNLETRTNDIVSSVNTLTQDVLDNTAAIGTLQTNVNANTAAIAKSKEKMTLLADITVSKDTTDPLELINNTKISTFYIETSIAAASATANGQIICTYDNQQTIYLTAAPFARPKTVTNITINAIAIGGFHLYILGQHSASSVTVLGNTQTAIYKDSTIVNKIVFKLLNNVSIPAGSTFKIYGIVED